LFIQLLMYFWVSLSISMHLMFYRSYYRGRLFIVPVILFAFIYTIPKFFELQLEEIPFSSDLLLTAENASSVNQKFRLVPTDLVTNLTFQSKYHGITDFLSKPKIFIVNQLWIVSKLLLKVSLLSLEIMFDSTCSGNKSRRQKVLHKV
jgi:hypothetical protein